MRAPFTHLTSLVLVLVDDEAVSPLLVPDLRRLKMALRLLVFLKMGLLPEVDSAWKTMEGSNTFVNTLMHVAIAGGSEDLEWSNILCVRARL